MPRVSLKNSYRDGKTFTNRWSVSSSLIAFTEKEPKDYMVPSRWGTVRKLMRIHKTPYKPSLAHFISSTAHGEIETDQSLVGEQREDPYAPQQSQGCCSVM